MKAFLSHSSKDKGFIEDVAKQLRPGTFELDSLTFDYGLLNSTAIVDSLKRSDLFCLFLSRFSIDSTYVRFETLFSTELFARGDIKRVVVICLDDQAFERAGENVKFFNIIRRSLSAENAARLIQGHLITAAADKIKGSRPFVGREEELVTLEKQVSDPSRPSPKAVFISGNAGSGRRTVAIKFYEDQYPHVGKVFPVINLHEFSGLEEIYRTSLSVLRPSLKVGELRRQVEGFAIASLEEKRRLIAHLLNSLLAAHEATFLFDTGGLLADSGQLEPEIDQIVSFLNERPHPPVVFISPRMVPFGRRRPQNDIAYLPVQSLKREATERLISRLLRDRDITFQTTELAELVALSDGHPFNVYRMIEEIENKTLPIFLGNPGDFVEWKHRQSSEYLVSTQLSDTDISILAVLNQVPELDFASFISALDLDTGMASDSLSRLIELHIIEPSDDRFTVAPALRIAVERDKRIRLPQDVYYRAVRALAQSLSMRLEEGSAPVSLIDAAVVSSLESGTTLSAVAAAFLLPSHNVWMAKKHYDQRRWEDSIRFAEEALKGADRLSRNGFVAACRFICLAGARTGNSTAFEFGIAELQRTAADNWAKSNVSFLKGFNERLSGNLPAAEDFFRSAYELSPGNLSAARELAAICLARGKLDEGEIFAREAHSQASRNPYFLDILIAILVKKYGRKARDNAELNQMFDTLEEVDKDSSRSFFVTRKAELEHLFGDNRTALQLVEEAIRKTPSIFEPRRLHAEVLLKEGNKSMALQAINVMRDIVNARDPNDRRSNFRAYLETYSHYLTAIGNYEDAKAVYQENKRVFSEEEIKSGIRMIEIDQAHRRE